jgi:hypothetical protein
VEARHEQRAELLAQRDRTNRRALGEIVIASATPGCGDEESER